MLKIFLLYLLSKLFEVSHPSPRRSFNYISYIIFTYTGYIPTTFFQSSTSISPISLPLSFLFKIYTNHHNLLISSILFTIKYFNVDNIIFYEVITYYFLLFLIIILLTMTKKYYNLFY